MSEYEKDKLYCPLFVMSPAFETMKGCECRKEMCAWWVEDKQKCAVAAIGGERNRGSKT